MITTGFLRSLAGRRLVTDDGAIDYVYFIRLSTIKPLSIYVITFLKEIIFNTIYGILLCLEKTYHAHLDSPKFSQFALTRGTT